MVVTLIWNRLSSLCHGALETLNVTWHLVFAFSDGTHGQATVSWLLTGTRVKLVSFDTPGPPREDGRAAIRLSDGWRSELEEHVCD